MTELEAQQLVQDGHYLKGKEITVNFTNAEDKITRTALCTVSNRISTLGIGEDGGPKNYSVTVWVYEIGNAKRHALPLRQVIKSYPNDER